MKKAAPSFLEFCRIGDAHSNVYLVGSLAKRVTIYSQQVRALNLIWALFETGRLRAGQELAVIGAGAAGLTAAAAGAQKGLKVRIIERHGGPLEVQANNRQRWLHPHLYDWPNEEYEYTDNAFLPILNWHADYAERVVAQMLKSWQRLQKDFDIQAYYGAPQLNFSGEDRLFVSARGRDKNGEDAELVNQRFDAVILAVGFGLEKGDLAHQWSYWDEDDLDGDFRISDQNKTWIISGSGDGGLTDLMRLCIRRFRHAKVLSLFSGRAVPLRKLKEQLTNITRLTDATEIHEAFCAHLEISDLAERLKPTVRAGGPGRVTLATASPLYGPHSSILNRLIVRILQHLGAFTLISSKVEITPQGDKFHARWKAGEGDFDYAIERHGPEAELKQEQWKSFQVDLDELKKKWEPLREIDAQDFTKKRLWSPRYFNPVRYGSHGDLQPRTFQELMMLHGVGAERLQVTKIVETKYTRFVYELEGLQVSEGAISGFWLFFRTTGGSIGEPIHKKHNDKLGEIWWERHVSQPSDDVEYEQVPLARYWQGTRSGIVWFERPLTVDSGPVNLKWEIRALACDVLTAWESLQLYGERHIKRADKHEAQVPVEYLSRVVWFPVKKLVIKTTAPELTAAGPYEKTFFWAGDLGEWQGTSESEARVLFLNPAPDSVGRWLETQPSGSTVKVSRDEETDRTFWELEISDPKTNYWYTLEWKLPSIEVLELSSLFSQVDIWKKALSQISDLVKQAVPASRGGYREEFKKLSQEIAKDLGISENDFDVSLMSYRNSELGVGEMFVVGAVFRGDYSEELSDFKLPFGAGVAGRCFREGNRGVRYSKREAIQDRSAPQYYLKLPNHMEHELMVSVPVFANPPVGVPQGFEPARLCFGVLSVGFLQFDQRAADADPQLMSTLSKKATTLVSSLLQKYLIDSL